jgi:uncharacterized repeat protein (TIGR01451 family)
VVRGLPRGLVVLVALALSGISPACGSGETSLDVSLTSDQQPAKPGAVPTFKPGDTPTFTITVLNKGPGGAAGVTVHADLPGGFRYKDTKSLDTVAAGVRTQPIDAQVNSQTPVWGIWNLTGPGTGVTIAFEAVADGAPTGYNVVARASGDTTAGDALSKPLAVQLAAAPKLSMSVAASPTAVHPGDPLTYTVSITNDGTGIATGVAVLVTLPPVVAFDSSLKPFPGNYSRNGGTEPPRGALLAYYDGFDLPAKGQSGPGLLNLTFRVQVLKDAGAPGEYAVGVQLTDASTDRINLASTAPVHVG